MRATIQMQTYIDSVFHERTEGTCLACRVSHPARHPVLDRAFRYGHCLAMDSPFILSRTIPDIPDIATPCYSWRRAGACNWRLALRSLLRCFLPVHTNSSDTWKVSKGTVIRDREWTRGKHTHVRHT